MDMQKKTVFVVDDSFTTLGTVVQALEDEYNVTTFSSALRMFSILDRVIPDLIFLDVAMPGINGFETLKRLKANPAFARIPVIFLTG